MKDYLKAARDAERRKAWDEAAYFATMATMQPTEIKVDLDPGAIWMSPPNVPTDPVPKTYEGIPIPEVIRDMWKQDRDEVNWWKHGVNAVLKHQYLQKSMTDPRGLR